MDLIEVGRTLRTRWYVLVPVLALTATATVGADVGIATKYQDTSTITLLASPQTTKGTAAVPGTGNPFLGFDSSLNDTADFLSRRLDSAAAAADLAARGVTESYDAALAANANGPFIVLTVTGSNAAHVRASLDTLVGYSSSQLRSFQQQAGVPAASLIQSMVIVPPGSPAVQSKRKIQAVLGIGIVGTVIAFMATFITDNIANARRRSRRGRYGAPRAFEDIGDTSDILEDSFSVMPDMRE